MLAVVVGVLGERHELRQLVQADHIAVGQFHRAELERRHAAGRDERCGPAFRGLILHAFGQAFIHGIRRRVERQIIERDRKQVLHRLLVAVERSEARKRSVAIDHRGVLVAIVERAEIHEVGEHLMPQIDVLEGQPAYLRRRRICALVVLEPAECCITLVSSRAVEVIVEAAEDGPVAVSEQRRNVAAKVDEPRVMNAHRAIVDVEAREIPRRARIALLESVVCFRIPVDAARTFLLAVAAAWAPAIDIVPRQPHDDGMREQ